MIPPMTPTKAAEPHMLLLDRDTIEKLRTGTNGAAQSLGAYQKARAARLASEHFCLDCKAGVPHWHSPGVYCDPRKPGKLGREDYSEAEIRTLTEQEVERLKGEK